MQAGDKFFFLNKKGNLSGRERWSDPSQDKLWLYNLHYFDDLNAVGASERIDWHRVLVQRWIDENPASEGNGWESYPLSLRIVNWIKWGLNGNEMEAAWLDSLAMQVRFLRKRLEYHLLGNHLFANAKALVFAGLYFSGDEAEEWLEKGLSILGREVPEQVLGDGGHFERSPMYHAIVLEGLLDLVNVCIVYDAFATRSSLLQAYSGTIHGMLAWLKIMSHPDGHIGFFNDSALGIAPTLSQLDHYADDLGLQTDCDPTNRLSHLPDSGYIRLDHGTSVALLDVGEIGPDYLPGHAHADTLSFELSLFGQRVIVNSGTSSYNVGKERTLQRGTAAHSTVEINGTDSSEVWGGFRVARRARPFDLEIQESAGSVAVSCSHDGYKRLPGKPVHRRRWEIQSGQLVVTDRIDGKYREAVAFYHLQPDVKASFDEDGDQGLIELVGGQSIQCSVAGARVVIEDTTYHPEFGLAIPNQTIKLVFTGPEAVFGLKWDTQ